MTSVAVCLQLRSRNQALVSDALEQSIFAGVCAVAPTIHSRPDWHILPVSGQRASQDVLHLRPDSCLTIRLPAHDLGGAADLLMLRSINLANTEVSVHAVRVLALRPSAALSAYGVVASRSKESIGLDLSERYPGVTVAVGKAVSLTIRGQAIWGSRVRVSGLTDEQSLDLQTRGYGKHKHYGRGVFTPWSHQ